MTNDQTDRRLRHAVQLEAQVRRGDGRVCASVVTNLSLEGCCLTGDYTIGEAVELELKPIGRLKGQIRWAFIGRAGVRFIRDSAEAPDAKSDGVATAELG